MCAFLYTGMTPRVQMCLCLSARVLIEKMAFAHGTRAHSRAQLCPGVCVCVRALARPCVHTRVLVYLPPHHTCL